MDVSLIGYLVGAREASVFVLVSSLTWLPTTLPYGIFEELDVLNKEEYTKIVNKYQVDTIIHMAALLSATAEKIHYWHGI